MSLPLSNSSKTRGNICIIIDMRVANQAIKREMHPIPTAEEIVQEISGACHSSKLDCRSGFQQFQLDVDLKK